MRRTPLALVVLAAVTLVACGGDDDDADTADTADTTAPSATSAASDETVPEVSLEPATTVPKPEVQIPTQTPTELVVTELQPGEGPEAANGDTVVVDYIGVRSEDGTEFDSSYGATPISVTLGAGGVIDGWEQGLVGAQAGQQLQLDIPSELAYGDQPQGEIIQAGDALTFVIDVRAVLPPADPADEPTAEDIPRSTEIATEPSVEDLVEGDGATLELGQTAAFQLVAARADDGTVLESTWTSGAPQIFTVEEGALLPGLIETLPGMKVGGRRAVTLPPIPEMGLTPETNIVIVADLLAVF
ncbi:MAG TPA: FKBP-type peptidyl-prolyl cis-trans isomerase [Ilumatobacteraceae bacterium]|nr:FKBP-type peptidyl-prolyl cis-trans isomerase [Ilumatobacteraceae bacterium]